MPQFPLNCGIDFAEREIDSRSVESSVLNLASQIGENCARGIRNGWLAFSCNETCQGRSPNELIDRRQLSIEIGFGLYGHWR